MTPSDRRQLRRIVLFVVFIVAAGIGAGLLYTGSPSAIPTFAPPSPAASAASGH